MKWTKNEQGLYTFKNSDGSVVAFSKDLAASARFFILADGITPEQGALLDALSNGEALALPHMSGFFWRDQTGLLVWRMENPNALAEMAKDADKIRGKRLWDKRAHDTCVVKSIGPVYVVLVCGKYKGSKRLTREHFEHMVKHGIYQLSR